VRREEAEHNPLRFLSFIIDSPDPVYILSLMNFHCRAKVEMYACKNHSHGTSDISLSFGLWAKDGDTEISYLQLDARDLKCTIMLGFLAWLIASNRFVEVWLCHNDTWTHSR